MSVKTNGGANSEILKMVERKNKTPLLVAKGFGWSLLIAILIVFLMSLGGCAGGPLSTREKGAGIGALGGAAVGGIIGAATGHPGAGAAIGGALGLGAGALIGDQLQGQENRQNELDKQIQEQERELERLRRERERLNR